jgi:hypothetical protein
MARKLLKATVRRCPPVGTPEHEKWRENVAKGMRRAKRRRKTAGLLTLVEIAVRYELPLGFVRRKADARELTAIQAGRRRYFRIEDVEQAFGKTAAA